MSRCLHTWREEARRRIDSRGRKAADLKLHAISKEIIGEVFVRLWFVSVFFFSWESTVLLLMLPKKCGCWCGFQFQVHVSVCLCVCVCFFRPLSSKWSPSGLLKYFRSSTLGYEIKQPVREAHNFCGSLLGDFIKWAGHSGQNPRHSLNDFLTQEQAYFQSSCRTCIAEGPQTG